MRGAVSHSIQLLYRRDSGFKSHLIASILTREMPQNRAFQFGGALQWWGTFGIEFR
jgi:hypothetical protein